jgi:hypothetical protein
LPPAQPAVGAGDLLAAQSTRRHCCTSERVRPSAEPRSASAGPPHGALRRSQITLGTERACMGTSSMAFRVIRACRACCRPSRCWAPWSVRARSRWSWRASTSAGTRITLARWVAAPQVFFRLFLNFFYVLWEKDHSGQVGGGPTRVRCSSVFLNSEESAAHPLHEIRRTTHRASWVAARAVEQ